MTTTAHRLSWVRTSPWEGRMGEMWVGIKWREVAESFNTAGLGEDWFQTGRAGSRDLPSRTGEHSPQEAVPALLGCRDERSLVNKGGEAGTQAMHGLELVCSLQLWPVIISLRRAGIACSITRCPIAPRLSSAEAGVQHVLHYILWVLQVS